MGVAIIGCSAWAAVWRGNPSVERQYACRYRAVSDQRWFGLCRSNAGQVAAHGEVGNHDLGGADDSDRVRCVRRDDCCGSGNDGEETGRGSNPVRAAVGDHRPDRCVVSSGAGDDVGLPFTVLGVFDGKALPTERYQRHQEPQQRLPLLAGTAHAVCER